MSNDGTVLIQKPDEMCRMLQTVCRDQAAAFAREQHDKARWTDDNPRARFWHDVMVLLVEERGDLAPRSAADSGGVRAATGRSRRWDAGAGASGFR